MAEGRTQGQRSCLLVPCATGQAGKLVAARLGHPAGRAWLTQFNGVWKLAGGSGISCHQRRAVSENRRPWGDLPPPVVPARRKSGVKIT
jgi:hypothetical protein